MIEIRTIANDEIQAYREAVSIGFGDDEAEREDPVGGFLDIFNPETAFAAFDRGMIVATFASFDLDVVVPGGSIAMAGTTVVTVQPTHRRRGILTDLMTRHLEQAVERGQVAAGLWASEEPIYGRFGYGQAIGGLDTTIASSSVTLPPGPPDVSIRRLTVDDARAAVPPIFARNLPRMAGSFARTDRWWEERQFRDHAYRRPRGASASRYVVAERESGGGPVGYAIYRQASHSASGSPGDQVIIVEVVADDDDARRALWSYLTHVDLYPNVVHWNLAVDDPLLIEADRFRSVQGKWRDSLWFRPLDVAACLEARTYERDGSLSIAVVDDFLDRGGVFALEASGGAACCDRLADSAAADSAAVDVTLDIADLGALYFGGRSANTLRRAGRFEASATTVATLDRLFATTAAPYCIEVF